MHPVDLDLSILMKPAMIYTVLVIIAITKLKKKWRGVWFIIIFSTVRVKLNIVITLLLRVALSNQSMTYPSIESSIE